MKVTLHNHKHIEEEGKPIIPNLVFKETIDRMKAGDKEAYKFILTQYSLTTFQKDLLNQLHGNNY